MHKDKDGREFIYLDAYGEVTDGPCHYKYIPGEEYGFDFEYKIYLDEEDMGEKKLTLEDITKRRLIKSIRNVDTKMKLIKPEIYNDIRNFYLTINSL